MTDDVSSPNVEPEAVPAAPEEVLPAVDESVNVELSEEEKLRQEASRRMERRKRKMMSPEERLAKITGRPVEPVALMSDVVSSGGTVPPAEVAPAVREEDDPPLENLTRDPFTADTPTMEGEFLTNILGGQANTTPVSDPVQFSQSVWVFLAVAVRLLLETEFSWVVGHNMVGPFIVMISILITTRYLDIASLNTSSLLTAGKSQTGVSFSRILTFLFTALMLCGVDQRKVALLTKLIHFCRILVQSFSSYLFTFLVCHAVLVHVVDQI